MSVRVAPSADIVETQNGYTAVGTAPPQRWSTSGRRPTDHSARQGNSG